MEYNDNDMQALGLPDDGMQAKVDQIKAEIEKAPESVADPYEIDLSHNYPEPKFALFQDITGTLPCGDIAAVKAKSKNGKSFLCSIFAASMLGCEDFGFRAANPDAVVFYFDTEQNERNTARLGRRVHRLCGWNEHQKSDRFRIFTLRKMDAKSMFSYIQDIVLSAPRRPDMVVIDGIADLIDDFNDIKLSDECIKTLMQMSANYDCTILCVLHENKSKGDYGMKGHLGTLLLQKSSDVFQVTYDKGQFNVEETDCRNRPIAGLSFSVDDDGIPFLSETLQASRDFETRKKVGDVLIKCFSDTDTLRRTELEERYCNNAMCKESTAYKWVKFALENDILIYDNNTKLYSLTKI